MSDRIPDLSLVMPCYNEEASLRQVVWDLLECFFEEQIILQLVVVNNGSTDQTPEIISELISDGLPITRVDIDVNQGYGNGILRGFEKCRAPVIGFIHSDGQVLPKDVLAIYRSLQGRKDRVLAKARRKYRLDGLRRKFMGVCYNAIMTLMFGWLGGFDVNASPKMFAREHFNAMQLTSRDWFLDPEIMIKAKYLGLRIIEVDVEGLMRQGGESKVVTGTVMEFLKNILNYRFGKPLRTWLKETKANQSINRQPPRVISSAPTHSLNCYSQLFRNTDAASLLESVHVVDQPRYEDTRGFLQKILSASQGLGNMADGEVYVTAAYAGQVKGNHYHLRMGEWFTVVQGEGSVEVCEPESQERRSIPFSTSQPRAVYVPAGLAHAVVNKGDHLLVCVAAAEKEHDPEDVYPYTVWPPSL